VPDQSHRPRDIRPLPDTAAGGLGDAGRRRRADAIARREATRLSAQHEGTLPAVRAGYGERAGLPDSAAGPGREEAVADGLYEWGESARGTGIRPDVPEGEPDSFDLPPLPYMPRGGARPARDREAEAGE
jgi:hypothetical protein